MSFRVMQMQNSSVLYLHSIRDRIMLDPEYQRMGGVWPSDKKALLIDTIINEFDIPKIYFHDLVDYGKPNKKGYEFAIVDGRQRLEAVWGFINGEFPLSDDFEYFRDSSVKAKGLTYSQLASKYPQLKLIFDARTLSVFVVQTDDIELIEEMFSRLNEAVPLNAAEKRNAFGGSLPGLVREISVHAFFRKFIKIKNNRYQHLDLATKLLYLTYSKNIEDTKKIYLDNFFKRNKGRRKEHFTETVKALRETLDLMTSCFIHNDPLLKSAGMIVLYYLLFKHAPSNAQGKIRIPRSKLLAFEKARDENRARAEENIEDADFNLLEFDRLTQTPNDSYAIRFRLERMQPFVYNK
jgi:hypothetical protein